MWNFIKLVGFGLLALMGFCLALGIGALIAALTASLGTVLVGGAVILVIILVVKELFESRP